MTDEKQVHLEYISKKYDETNIPLYLSYPTTSFWRDPPDEKLFAKSYTREESPFLYFHFPYCKKPCYYCCCYKEVTSSDEKKETYIGYVEKEFELKLRLFRTDRLTGISQLHWGGGTPTYMSESQIERVFRNLATGIELAQTPDSCISIEAYPDEEMLGVSKLTLLRSLGFNEISFGVQDFDERIQKTINRDSDPASVRRLAEQVKQLGFRLNIDLCYGLPHQGIPEIEKTIEQILLTDADKIAVFPYAHYPMIFPLQRKIDPSSVQGSLGRIMLIRRAEELFESAGYKRLGLDHFVKPDNPLYLAYNEKKAIKDFMGYSTADRRSFIGFGNSAISFLGDGYYHNTCSLANYYSVIDHGALPFETGMNYRLTYDDKLRNRLIQKSILTDFVIDKNEIESEFDIDFDSYFKKELVRLSEYEKDGLVESVTGDRICVTEPGRYVVRHIAYAFDRFYGTK
jgi:oxygen-independent coproporphyrinogen-3 oxidase